MRIDQYLIPTPRYCLLFSRDLLMRECERGASIEKLRQPVANYFSSDSHTLLTAMDKKAGSPMQILR